MIYIRDLNENDRVESVYFIESAETRPTKGGTEFLRVTMKDKTGKIMGNAWDLNAANVNLVKTGDYALVSGEVYVYNDQLQFKIYGIRKANENEYNISDYLEVSKRDIKDMEEELKKFIDKVDNKYLKELLVKIFIEDEQFFSDFCKHPAARAIHHNYIGGLIEHTLGVARISESICNLYEKVNKSLLLTGAVLHDIGKVYEMSKYPIVEYTDKGQFLGHIIIGINIIHDKIREIKDFPSLLEIELEHLILSHHGEYEFGSPKKPAILEAFILNYADNLDAKIEVFRKELSNIPNTNWTKTIYSLDTPIRKTEVDE